MQTSPTGAETFQEMCFTLEPPDYCPSVPAGFSIFCFFLMRCSMNGAMKRLARMFHCVIGGFIVLVMVVFQFAAYCRNSVDGLWYSYDDSSVDLIPEEEVCTRGAYILFYERRNAIPPWSASCSVRGTL